MREHDAYPIPAPTLPVLYWPEDARTYWPWPRINRRHRPCGGWLYATPPSVLAQGGAGDVSCLHCSAIVAEVKTSRGHPLLPARPMPQVAAPEPSPAPRVTATTPASRHASSRHLKKPCPECDLVEIKRTTARCRDCNTARRNEHGVLARLVALLDHGRPVTRASLRKALGISDESLRAALKNVRVRRGVVIVKESVGVIRMEVDRE